MCGCMRVCVWGGGGGACMNACVSVCLPSKIINFCSASDGNPFQYFSFYFKYFVNISVFVLPVLSNRAFKEGDLKFAEKWSQYAFLTCMITVVVSIVIYIAIGFSLSPIGLRGGHSY